MQLREDEDPQEYDSLRALRTSDRRAGVLFYFMTYNMFHMRSCTNQEMRCCCKCDRDNDSDYCTRRAFLNDEYFECSEGRAQKTVVGKGGREG